ncbi:hypothetical protein O6H91_11G119300 [Diphasiastrum complanatum]|uniref:Uncharacterized protein n=1 Tax=Diphasiastrum complanatum TaxID=34168 RepID=A0ACC2CDI1_DIPCM|nr:hypothetical protein O6H91_11G119300 [Diphasiastrum complanatum]
MSSETSYVKWLITALFRSLLYEACGRTVNPVHGAVGLLWSGNWPACQAAVEAVLKGEILQPVTASLPAGPHDSSFTHFPLTELGRQPEGGFSALPVWQHASTGTVMDRAHKVNVEQDSFRPSLQLSSSECGKELLEIGFRTVKTNPLGDDICNLLKTMQSERNGELHPRKKALKRKHEEANSQQPVGSAVQRASTGIETLLEAIQRTDRPLEAPPESDIVLDLTLSSHPATAPPWQIQKLAATRNTSPEDHSVSSEGSVTSLDTAGLSVSQVALVQRHLTL